MPTAIFHGYLTTSSLFSREQIIAQITEGDDMKLYYLSRISRECLTSGSPPPFRGIEESPAVFNCSNGGILLPNSTCVCPPFISGPQCDIISVQSNLDTSHQSFILVLNLRSTMAYDLHQLINQVKSMSRMIPRLSDSVVSATNLENSYFMKNEIFTSSDALLDYLNGVVISTGDTDQPTISAINSVHSSLMHPASVVYVFADSAASDARSFNPKLSSSSPEMLAIQRTLAWRNKLAIFLSETDSDPIDYFGDYFDVFRRLVRATQGDLIVIEKTRVTEVRGKRNEFLVRVSFKNLMPRIKLIRTTATATTMITVTAKKQSSVNIRVWINSPNTVFIGSSPDPAVDVGSTVVSSGTILTIPSDIVGLVFRRHSFFSSVANEPSPVAMKCFNGGTLQGGGVCNCTAFFYGPNCATPVCLNGGVQEKFPGNGRPLCQCPVGYGGDHCEVCEYRPHHLLILYCLLTKLFSLFIVRVLFCPSPLSLSYYFLSLSRNSQSISQPSTAALLQTINSISYDKSSIFLFTDAIPVANTQRTDVTNIVVAAIERQLQINIVITAPYQMNEMCIQSSDAGIYSLMALQTGGTIVNLCQPYFNSYPRDIITEVEFTFFTGYGMTHHHVETLRETVVEDCSVLFVTDFFVDDPTTQVYAFVNSGTVFQQVLQCRLMACFLKNNFRYALQVQSVGNSTKGPCSVRIVEKTQLAVYLAFTSDPSKDSPFLTLNYGTQIEVSITMIRLY
ncbi:unnamed protein product [Haemonchus placei]|uniref:EGF-like domain-containing protein n=1 Tax=Haemonchus placei TaxID=6290 RepID=A0A158QJQ9_HAEPC|nr:unnamed protein product [Haemonchus placei]